MIRITRTFDANGDPLDDPFDDDDDDDLVQHDIVRPGDRMNS